MKERLDVLLVNRGLAASREKAKAMIMAGIVYVDGQKEDKAGTLFDEAAAIEVRGATLKYVSRGGLKLEKAMTAFGVEAGREGLHGRGRLHRRLYGLHAAGRGGEGLLGGRGPRAAGLEAAKRPAGGLHGKDQHPLRDAGGYRGPDPLRLGIDVSFISLTKVLGPVRQLLTEDRRSA